jgi:hypothetical protein
MAPFAFHNSPNIDVNMEEDENNEVQAPQQDKKARPVSGFEAKRYEPPQPRPVVKPAALQQVQNDGGKKSPVQPRNYQNIGNKKLGQKPSQKELPKPDRRNYDKPW